MDTQVAITLGSTLITAITTLAAAAITAWFGFRSVAKSDEIAAARDELQALRRELVAAYRQIAAYHSLEDEYVQSLHEVHGGSEKSIKIAQRDRIEDLGLERPQTTRNQAEKRIRELEL